MKKKIKNYLWTFFLAGAVLSPILVKAGEHAEESSGGGHAEVFALTFGILALLLILAKLGSLVERIGQPAVLGEILVGVLLGNLALIGIPFFRNLEHFELLTFLAEFGVVILLFQIGLESNITEMKKVGVKSFVVAIIGVIAPFVLGTYVIGPYMFPGLSQITYLFLGAALTATSVGITARVFKDLNKLQISEAKIVLGAAVIDDILGLLILAVVSAIATVGTVSAATIGIISLKALAFLVGGIIIGSLLAPMLGKIFSRIHTGVGMKVSLALAIGLFFAFLAAKVGLAPIVGAFVAGLILDPVHFKGFKNFQFVHDLKKWLSSTADEDIKKPVQEIIEKHSHKHVEDLIETIAYIFVPIFFIYTGLQVKIETLFDWKVLLLALVVTLIAIFGKVIAGAFIKKPLNKWLVGFGMVPRGEVGLIFANIGKSLGVISDQLFSVVVIMVILTTLLTPPILTSLLKRHKEEE